MTTEEAAATLGLTPTEATTEAIEQNYREKVKRCHPDRADYPGAAAEFKRATLAFDTLRGQSEPTRRGGQARDVVDAAERFTFVASFTENEIWAGMPWWELMRSLLGVHIRPIDLLLIPEGLPLVVRSFGRNPNEAIKPILVAPIDVELLDIEREGDELRMTLRPIDTDRVGDYLKRSLAEGLSLGEASARLADKLNQAAKEPLRGSAGVQKGAA